MFFIMDRIKTRKPDDIFLYNQDENGRRRFILKPSKGNEIKSIYDVNNTDVQKN